MLLQIAGGGHSTWKDPYRQRHGVGPVQFWSEELARQGNQQTREGGKRGRIQVFAPGSRDILEQDPDELMPDPMSMGSGMSSSVIPCQ